MKVVFEEQHFIWHGTPYVRTYTSQHLTQSGVDGFTTFIYINPSYYCCCCRFSLTGFMGEPFSSPGVIETKTLFFRFNIHNGNMKKK
mmetsp:Transcript_4751/g.6479  ORF Transcript_4751/g.6479 Transcript_4751/m.6479 type:complete len:87 (-) Transcript_4751:5-265(-)